MNFSQKEISCRCGCGQRLNLATVKMLELARHNGGGEPIVLSSPSRCKAHNSSLKNSSPVSLHIYDMAADVIAWGKYRTDTVEGREKIAALFRKSGWYVMIESRWVHVDLRTMFPEILKVRLL